MPSGGREPAVRRFCHYINMEKKKRIFEKKEKCTGKKTLRIKREKKIKAP